MRFVGVLLLTLVAGCFSKPADVAGDDGDDGDDDAIDGSPGAPDANVPVGEPPELAGTTAAHNAVREAHGVAPLAWDPALAAIAQAWVEQCIDTEAPTGLVDHNADRSDGAPYAY